MYNYKEVGERIKELRKNHNMTQERLAAVLHLSDKGAVSKIENGVKLLSVDNTVTIAVLFGVSLDYLIRGERFADNGIVSMLNQMPVEYQKVAEMMITAALSSLLR